MKYVYFCGFLLGSPLIARQIFLNGIDISSAVQQRLNQVNVMIDEHGNIHLDAPHYEAVEENHYLPLKAIPERVEHPPKLVESSQVNSKSNSGDSKVGEEQGKSLPSLPASPDMAKQNPIDKQSASASEK